VSPGKSEKSNEYPGESVEVFSFLLIVQVREVCVEDIDWSPYSTSIEKGVNCALSILCMIEFTASVDSLIVQYVSLSPLYPLPEKLIGCFSLAIISTSDSPRIHRHPAYLFEFQF
jgi:hypothetical protein